MNRLLLFTLTRGYARLEVLCKLIRIVISIVSRWRLSMRNVFRYLHRWLTVKLARDNGYDNIACSSSQTALGQALADGRITPAPEVASVRTASTLVALPAEDNMISNDTVLDEDEEEDTSPQRPYNGMVSGCQPTRSQQNGAEASAQKPHFPPKELETVPIIPDLVVFPSFREPSGKYPSLGAKQTVSSAYDARLVTSALPRWTPCIHPGGALYYYNSQMRVFTDADLTGGTIATQINLCAKKLRDQAQSKQMWSEDAELTLEIMEGNGNKCGYYFTRHGCRQLFWIEDIDDQKAEHVNPMLHNVKVINKRNQLKYAMESQYWCHCALYPNHRLLPESVLREVRQIVVHFNGEMLLSDASLSPFDKVQLGAFLDLMDTMKDSIDQTDAHAIATIGGMMRSFCPSVTLRRVYDFKPSSQSLIMRSNAKATVKDCVKSRFWACLRSLLVLLLWNSPNAHLKALKRVWVDSVIIETRWTNFTAQLTKEWNQITVLSTVILAVNISFLAVPGVLVAGAPPGAQATSIYVSTLCIVGSLV
ncbi:hypothetical protein HYDPIDRAFT_28634, partial [Hydnomerulius pinastri MD-312]